MSDNNFFLGREPEHFGEFVIYIMLSLICNIVCLLLCPGIIFFLIGLGCCYAARNNPDSGFWTPDEITLYYMSALFSSVFLYVFLRIIKYFTENEEAEKEEKKEKYQEKEKQEKEYKIHNRKKYSNFVKKTVKKDLKKELNTIEITKKYIDYVIAVDLNGAVYAHEKMPIFNKKYGKFISSGNIIKIIKKTKALEPGKIIHKPQSINNDYYLSKK